MFRTLNETLEGMTSVVDRVDHLTDVFTTEAIIRSDHLAKKSSDEDESWDFFTSPLMGNNMTKSIFGGAGALPEDSFH